MREPAPLRYSDSELVLGIVGAVGADLQSFDKILRQRISLFNYKTNPIRLSEFLENLENVDLGIKLTKSPEAARLDTYMTAGNKVRELTERGDILSLYAAQKINDARKDDHEPQPRTVHIIRSLKHPDEARTLRQIYGGGFFLIGVFATEKERSAYLTKDLGCTPEKAKELMKRDEDEQKEFGQKTRDTFQLADVFIPVSKKKPLWRFLDLVFGHPFRTPTKDEYAMFLAFAAALRSADLSRQVGAVIMSANGEIVATGANDVPTAGGGLYWSGKGDKRDWKRGRDENEKRRNALIIEIMKKFDSEPEKGDELLNRGKELFAGSDLMDIMEFGRAVHAEMEALLAAARSGISPVGGTLYTTTFPCHNCAKHIVAAGIRRVVYVEPFPKSKAVDLHGDSITLMGSKNKVKFEPFSGIGPRRFFDLFSMGLSSGSKIERKHGGGAVEFDRSSVQLRVSMPPTSYIEREKLAVSELYIEREKLAVSELAIEEGSDEENQA